MKVKFITCIYNNLYGTDYGGRPSREHHYNLSLLSLLKMTDASFVMYTSSREYEALSLYFHKTHNISHNQLSIKVFDLENSKYYEKIRANKNLDKVKKSDRCYEIQFNKFYWIQSELDDVHTHFYWIDAGLSHTGLFPPKYKIQHPYRHREYYDFTLFNNLFLSNLIELTGNKVFVLGKDNTNGNYWSRSLPEKYYKSYDKSIHIIGGLFGGGKNQILEYIENFDKLLYDILENGELYFEELIMSTLYFNFKEKFELGYFQIWWYDPAGPYPPGHEIYKLNKPFYQVFEELQ